jgi:hypothetical protein
MSALRQKRTFVSKSGRLGRVNDHLGVLSLSQCRDGVPKKSGRVIAGPSIVAGR